ncbi:MAG: nuclear transport factor 2 family protein [Gammaproteobacteria bacterium]|nr:nuclear transport factor 2 family protein [Gammaproteobacteria bacterium]
MRLLLICLCLLQAACVSVDGTTNWYQGECQKSAEDCALERAAERMLAACTVTANSYPYARDRAMLDEYAQLFTEDAHFQIEGQPALQGRPALVAGLQARAAANELRHMSQVVDMQATGEGTARGVSYVTIWRVGAEAWSNGDRTVHGPWIVAEYHDEFRMQGKRCLISDRLVKIVFAGPDF